MATKASPLRFVLARRRRGRGLSFAISMALLAAPAGAQGLICRPVASAQGADTAHLAQRLGLRWIVLRSGEQLEARGAPAIHGSELRFRAVSGTLLSAPLATIDLEATEWLNREVLAGKCVDRSLPIWEAARVRRVKGLEAPDEPARRSPPQAAARPDRPLTRRHTLPRRPASPRPRNGAHRPR